MARKLVEDLEIGMVLSKDVKDDRGRFLLPEGIELGDSHLRLLRQWKISVVHIVSGQDDEKHWSEVDLTELQVDQHRANENHLHDLFALNDPEDMLIQHMYYFCLDRLDHIAVQREEKKA